MQRQDGKQDEKSAGEWFASLGDGGIAVLGAGSSGIAAAKILYERGLPFVCFEKGSGIGGNWRYQNDNEMSSAYWSLHINTSRDRMAYSDFPMPPSYPDFPHHTQIMEYFESYVDHFGFRSKIAFQTEIRDIEPSADGKGAWVSWSKKTGEEGRIFFRAVIIANGHHWNPYQPTFAGHFEGQSLHSHAYKTPDILQEKKVLVIGVGNSGCDIACESARHAKETWLSTRRGAHVIPKYLLGRPLDEWLTPGIAAFPMRLQQWAIEVLAFLARGSQKNYGFPTPSYRPGQEHPTISSELLNLVGHGKIKVKPDIQTLAGKDVHFVDGSVVSPDVIIYATGYRISFPFLAPGVFAVQDNKIGLYKRVIDPLLPPLFFLGLIQPLGAIMPLAEAQSEWIADLLEGKALLPPKDAMLREIKRDQEAVARRYTPSPRHTIQVDFFPYLASLQKERKDGHKRKLQQKPAL